MQILLRPELRSRLALRRAPAQLRPLVTAAFLMGSWGFAAAAPTPATRADSAGESAWLAHGFTAAQRESLREVWRWGIAEKLVPGGALLIVHRGETVFREAFGVADLATWRPFAVDTPCLLASVTKPFTATLFARLVEAGWLAWDDPVDKFLPQFAALEVRRQGRAKRAPLIRETCPCRCAALTVAHSCASTERRMCACPRTRGAAVRPQPTLPRSSHAKGEAPRDGERALLLSTHRPTSQVRSRRPRCLPPWRRRLARCGGRRVHQLLGRGVSRRPSSQRGR